jgi:hypothetical protein
MNTKRLAVGALVGAIALHGLGYLIFQLAFANFYAANVGSATGVPRDPNLTWAVALGNLSVAVLLTLAIGWARVASIAAGFRVGATVGFLMWFGVDFILYGINNVSNLTATIVDPLLELVHNGITGAIIVAVITRVAPSRSQAV